VSCKSCKNFGSLLRSLALTKDDFRHADAQLAMMIDFREPKVLEGQMAQPLNCIVRRYFAFTDLLKEFADGFGIQALDLASDGASATN